MDQVWVAIRTKSGGHRECVPSHKAGEANFKGAGYTAATVIHIAGQTSRQCGYFLAGM